MLLRPPFRLSFAYAGPDRIFRDSWHDTDRLPAAIMLTVRDARSERVLSVSTVTPVHADGPGAGSSDDDSKGDAKEGDAKDGSKDDGKIDGATPKQGGS